VADINVDLYSTVSAELAFGLPGNATSTGTASRSAHVRPFSKDQRLENMLPQQMHQVISAQNGQKWRARRRPKS
jgi:hypothetical protein